MTDKIFDIMYKADEASLKADELLLDDSGFLADADPRRVEVFAKLIVRECLRILDDSKDNAIERRLHVDEAMSTARFEIYEHFNLSGEA